MLGFFHFWVDHFDFDYRIIQTNHSISSIYSHLKSSTNHLIQINMTFHFSRRSSCFVLNNTTRQIILP